MWLTAADKKIQQQQQNATSEFNKLPDYSHNFAINSHMISPSNQYANLKGNFHLPLCTNKQSNLQPRLKFCRAAMEFDRDLWCEFVFDFDGEFMSALMAKLWVYLVRRHEGSSVTEFSSEISVKLQRLHANLTASFACKFVRKFGGERRTRAQRSSVTHQTVYVIFTI